MPRLITGDKSPAQLDAMREGGKILAQIFAELRSYVTAGLTGLDIDRFVGQQIAKHGVTATYRTSEVNFPGNICISLNDAIVHGVPNDQLFEKGDIVSFDLVITHRDMKVDSAFTMVVDSEPQGAIKLLLNATERSLYAGIDAINGSVRTGDIGVAIEKVLKKAKLGIVHELVGHGVGLQMHMPPELPNYGHSGTGDLLLPGDTVAIEPMATLGSGAIHTLEDDWTIATNDGSLSAHFEHTVLVTETGVEILTQI